MDPLRNNRIHLHGTLGSGKSYLLAALVCLLKREGRRVVYVPDCYELLLCEPAALYMLPAMYSAFHNDSLLGDQIKELVEIFFGKNRTDVKLEWKMTMFSNLAAQVGYPILYIIDQTNALDEGAHDRVSKEKKAQVRRFLDGLSSANMKVSSSTANYVAARYDETRATSETRLEFAQGLNDVSTP